MTTATKIAAANNITVDAADRIAAAYDAATGEWTGLDWTHVQSHGEATVEIVEGTTDEDAERMADEADARSAAMPGSADDDDLHLIQAKQAVEDEAEAYRAAARRIEEITSIAKQAEERAAEAIEWAAQGNLDNATETAQAACDYESEASGDCPVWSPLFQALADAKDQQAAE